MIWKTNYRQDTEKPGVGTVTADNGAATYSRRVDTNSPDDVAVFVQEALAISVLAVKLSGDASLVVSKIEAVLNAG